MTKERLSLLAAVLLAAFAIGILFLSSTLQMAVEVRQVAMVLLGLVSMAAVNAFTRVFESGISSSPLVNITFNEAQVRTALGEIVDVEKVDKRSEAVNANSLWEPTSDTLALHDPLLALAKLRIDIERELRRLAYENDLPSDARRLGISRLMQLLAEKEILSSRLVAAVNSILPVCNDAIHGSDIPRETALSVLSVGADVLSLLLKSQETGKFSSTA